LKLIVLIKLTLWSSKDNVKSYNLKLSWERQRCQ